MNPFEPRRSNAATRLRRTAFTNRIFEIGFPRLKKETSFISNPRSKGSRSGSAQLLPGACFEVDFFQAAWLSVVHPGVVGFKGFAQNSTLAARTMVWNKTAGPAAAGEKTSGF